MSLKTSSRYFITKLDLKKKFKTIFLNVTVQFIIATKILINENSKMVHLIKTFIDRGESNKSHYCNFKFKKSVNFIFNK